MGMGGGGAATAKVKQPTWVKRAAQGYSERAEEESKKPYVQYEGQRFADFNADENRAFEIARSSEGEWKPMLDESAGLARAGAAEWTAADYDKYASPYQKNVTDIAAREMLRNEDIARKSRGAAAADAGAFGSAQAGIQEAESDRNLQQNISDTYAKGQANAWDEAVRRFEADRAAKSAAGQQLAGLASQGQTQRETDVDRLIQTGGLQQMQEQQGLDWAYQQWGEAQDWNWGQIERGANVLGALPFEQKTQTESGNQKAQMIGGAVAATAAVAAVAVVI